jgi:Leucine-rich repeat (LRR) protein
VHWNRLEEVPPEVGKLTALHTLNLYINRLTTLPDELQSLTALENLDIAHNAFSTVSAPPLTARHTHDTRTYAR